MSIKWNAAHEPINWRGCAETLLHDVLAADVPLILLRHSSGLSNYAYVEGDAATHLRIMGFKCLRVTELNELSGTAQAVAEEAAK